MEFYLKVLLMFVVVWTFTAILDWSTDFNIFECFVIFVLSILLSTDLKNYLKELEK